MPLRFLGKPPDGSESLRLQAGAEVSDALAEGSAQGLWLLDLDGRTLAFNRRMWELAGCSSDGLISRSINDLVSWQRAGPIGDCDQSLMRLVAPQSAPLKGRWVCDPQGNPRAILVTAGGVYDEEAAVPIDLLEAAGIALVVSGEDGRVRAATPQAAGLLRVSVERLQGRGLVESLGESAHEIEDLCRRAREFRRAESCRVRLGDPPQWVQARAVPWGSRVIVFVEDATQTLETERRLRESDRLASIGRLAGGITHDFNNLLTIIIGSLECISERLTENDREVWEAARTALEASESAGGLVHSMMSMLWDRPEPTPQYDVAEAFSRLQVMLAPVLPPEVAIRWRTHARLWPVAAPRAELEAALLNLILNARDALGGRGRISVSARNGTNDAWKELSGQHVRVDVTDSGPGMTDSVADEAFKPFFSTKGSRRGLGLSSVEAFARRWGGRVEIDSRVGAGTTVTLYLPRGRETAGEEPVPKATARSVRARVLVVEEDPVERRRLLGALRRLGYRPVPAASARGGLRRLGRGERFGAVIASTRLGEARPGFAAQVRAVLPEVGVGFIVRGEAGAPSASVMAQSNAVVLSGRFGSAELRRFMQRVLAS